MKIRIITLVLLIVSILSFSYYARKHYFKIPPSLDDIDDYAVTYIFGNGGENEEFLESCLRKMEAKQVIMVVTATGENKSKYESTSFKAVVKHVYKGENYVSAGDEIEILNQSIMNGWQGIFPLNNQRQKPTKQEYVPKYLMNRGEQRNYDYDALEQKMNLSNRNFLEQKQAAEERIKKICAN